MKEKQPAKLSESCRLMQDSSKAPLFRSGAANDEFDGFARYSERKLAFGKLGGTASSSRPMWDGSFFYLCSYAKTIWVVPREEKLVPKDLLLYFIFMRRVQQMMP